MVGITCGIARFLQGHMCTLEHSTCRVRRVPLTNVIVPSVDGKYAAAGDRNHCRCGKMGQGVSGNMRNWRIGWKLQHHDDILLHLVLEHERTLREETLLSRRDGV